MLAAYVVDQPVRCAGQAGQLFKLAAIRLAAAIDEVKGTPHRPLGCALLYRFEHISGLGDAGLDYPEEHPDRFGRSP